MPRDSRGPSIRGTKPSVVSRPAGAPKTHTFFVIRSTEMKDNSVRFSSTNSILPKRFFLSIDSVHLQDNIFPTQAGPSAMLYIFSLGPKLEINLPINNKRNKNKTKPSLLFIFLQIRPSHCSPFIRRTPNLSVVFSRVFSSHSHPICLGCFENIYIFSPVSDRFHSEFCKHFTPKLLFGSSVIIFHWKHRSIHFQQARWYQFTLRDI